MSSSYPNAYDQFKVHVDNIGEQITAGHMNNIQDAVAAIQRALGLGYSSTAINSQLSSLQDQIWKLDYNQVNILEANYYNGLVTNKQGLKFDTFTDTTKVDMTSVTTSSALTAGQTVLNSVTTVPAGFKVGQEVLIQDDQNFEFTTITAVNPFLTVTALKYAYKSGAMISRTSSIFDTASRRINMPTVSIAGTASITAPTTVSTQAMTYSNNFRFQGVVVLQNGWVVVMLASTSTGNLYWFMTKDGKSFTQLAFANVANFRNTGAAMACYGNMVYTTIGWNTGQYLVKFDATTVQNTDQWPSKITIDSGTTVGGVEAGSAIATDSTGRIWVVWSSASTTYANSTNIKWSSSTDGGKTWSTATFLTTVNTSGSNYTLPDLLILPNGNPVITCQLTSSVYTLYSFTWTGTAFGPAKTIYTMSTYNQNWIKTACDSNGIIRAFWQGYSSTAAGTYNIFTSTSSDSGITWSTPVNLTNVTTTGYHQQHPFPTVDANNNWYLFFDGIDPTVNTSTAQVRRMVYSNANGTWSAPSTLTYSSSASSQQPVALCSTFNQNCNFIDPLFLYQDGQTGLTVFRGIWPTTLVVPTKASALYSLRTSFSQAQKNAKNWFKRTITVSSSAASSIAAGASSIPLSSMPSSITGTVFSDPMIVSTAWTTQSGSFAFGTGGATSNVASSLITATGGNWKAQMSSGGQALQVIAQATFTMPATTQAISLNLYANANLYFGAFWNQSTFGVQKVVNGTSVTLASAAFTLSANTTYTLTISSDTNGNLIAKLYNGSQVTVPVLTVTATDASAIGPFTIGIAAGTGVIAGNAQVTGPLPNFANGDIIEIREGNNWERVTISGAIAGSSLPISPTLVNSYSTSAIVSRVDETVQIFIGASGASETFVPMIWQGASVLSDGSVEDTYYYSTSTPGTDLVFKILQTRANGGISPQSLGYGAAIGI